MKKLGGDKKKMMNKKTFNLKNDKRAVSPVIGVILMVAITVILAAVIGAFVFGISPSAEKTPNAQLRAEAYTGNLTLKHMGGDPVSLGECVVKAGTDTLTITGSLTVGNSISSTAGYTARTAGDAVAVEIIHTPSQSYILDTIVTAR